MRNGIPLGMENKITGRKKHIGNGRRQGHGVDHRSGSIHIILFLAVIYVVAGIAVTVAGSYQTD